MQYSESEIREYAKKVVDETKRTANYDTGFLYRSIKYNYYRRTGKLEFRQVDYGAYNDNSKLIANAKKIMPNDIDWVVVFENEEGEESEIKSKTRSGRTIRAKSISNENESSKRIKALISAIKANGEKKDDSGKGNRSSDVAEPE
jgi:hypothetical protein